jgi:pSer/pThr/pTyr-binding forkhead associated (FHA) protein
VDLVPRPEVALHRVQVSACRQEADDEAEDSTRQMDLPPDQASEDPVPPNRPFVILEGRRHIPLTSASVSLGRHLDNDIIVDDSRVSRQHAQLRRRYGRYVIYDLGSTGGTSVNGYPVQECVLEAGDVISLAGVDVIYGEDSPTPPPAPPRGTFGTPAMPQTGEFSPASGDQPET